MKTHEEILTGIRDWLRQNFSAAGLGFTQQNITLLPPISLREDYKNFPPGKFPCLGPAMTSEDYEDKSLGIVYPMMRVQIIFSARQSGALEEEMMGRLYKVTQQLKEKLFETSRGDRFGMEQDIQSMGVIKLFTFPTFYTQVERDRKAFSIGYFTIDLRLAAG